MGSKVCIFDAQPQPFPYTTPRHALRLLPDGNEFVSLSQMDCQLEAALDAWEKSYSYWTYEEGKYAVAYSLWANSIDWDDEVNVKDNELADQMFQQDHAYVMHLEKRADEDMKWFYILLNDLTGWSPAWLTENWLNEKGRAKL